MRSRSRWRSGSASHLTPVQQAPPAQLLLQPCCRMQQQGRPARGRLHPRCSARSARRRTGPDPPLRHHARAVRAGAARAALARPGPPGARPEPVQALDPPRGSAARPGQAGVAAHQLPLACDLVRVHTQWPGAAQAGSAAAGRQLIRRTVTPAPRAGAGQGGAAAAAAEQPAAAAGQSAEAPPLAAEADDALEGMPLDSGSDSDSSASENGFRVGSRRRLAWRARCAARRGRPGAARQPPRQPAVRLLGLTDEAPQ